MKRRKPIKKKGPGASEWPLRKIVEEFTGDQGNPKERLECGHVINKKSDMAGHTNAYRRRCYKCSRAMKVPIDDIVTYSIPKSAWAGAPPRVFEIAMDIHHEIIRQQAHDHQVMVANHPEHGWYVITRCGLAKTMVWPRMAEKKSFGGQTRKEAGDHRRRTMSAVHHDHVYLAWCNDAVLSVHVTLDWAKFAIEKDVNKRIPDLAWSDYEGGSSLRGSEFNMDRHYRIIKRRLEV